MDRTNDINFMREYLKAALNLEQCRYSIIQSKNYVIQKCNTESKKIDAMDQKYIQDGITLAGADKEDYIKSNSVSTKKIVIFAILAGVFLIPAIAATIISRKDTPNVPLIHAFFVSFLGTLIPSILSIVFFFLMLSSIFEKKEKTKAALSAEYDSLIDGATKKWDALYESKTASEKRLAYYKEKSDELISEEKRISESLNQLYSENVLHPAYRRLDYIGTLYGYIQRGRCTTVKGHGGIYDTLETELKQNAIILGLDRISRQLNAIRANQRYLYDAIQEGNQIARNIRDEIESGNRVNQQLLSNMALEQKRHNAMQEWQNTRAYYGY